MNFGPYIRSRREALKREDGRFSLRRVAGRIGVEPAYLSKVERGIADPPSEEKILRLAAVLGEDSDALLARGGKVSSDLTEIIKKRPRLMGDLLRRLGRASDRRIHEITEGRKPRGR